MSCSSDAGYHYAAGTITCAEHCGTHVDAPFHFNITGAAVDSIPLKELIMKCVVIDISDKCSIDSNYALTTMDIRAFEKAYGEIDSHSIVIIRTGWWRKYHQGPSGYLGFDEKVSGKYDSKISNLRFPGIGAEAAEMLVIRRIVAVGLDTASLDCGNSKDFIAHRIFLENGVYGIENLNHNIELLKPIGSTLIVMPMKITGGSGAPARVIGINAK
eukprot:gene9276-12497_t